MKKYLISSLLFCSLLLQGQVVKDSRTTATSGTDVYRRLIVNEKNGSTTKLGLIVGSDTVWLVADGLTLDIISNTLLHNGNPIGSSGLEKLTEGTGTGWAIVGDDRSTKGDIGDSAIDMSVANYANDSLGATGKWSTAFGYNNLAGGSLDFVIGYNNWSVPNNSQNFVGGQGSKAFGWRSIAFGYQVQTAEINAFAIGYQTKAFEDEAFAGGKWTRALGQHSFGYTYGGLVYSNTGVVLGYMTIDSAANGGIATGYRTRNYGSWGFSGGIGADTNSAPTTYGSGGFTYQNVTAGNGLIGAGAANSIVFGGQNNNATTAAVRGGTLGGQNLTAEQPDVIVMAAIQLDSTFTTPANPRMGTMYTTSGKPMWWDGLSWIDLSSSGADLGNYTFSADTMFNGADKVIYKPDANTFRFGNDSIFFALYPDGSWLGATEIYASSSNGVPRSSRYSQSQSSIKQTVYGNGVGVDAATFWLDTTQIAGRYVHINDKSSNIVLDSIGVRFNAKWLGDERWLYLNGGDTSGLVITNLQGSYPNTPTQYGMEYDTNSGRIVLKTNTGDYWIDGGNTAAIKRDNITWPVPANYMGVEGIKASKMHDATSAPDEIVMWSSSDSLYSSYPSSTIKLRNGELQVEDDTTMLRLYPENPHYLEFKGEPIVVSSSSEPYGSVTNMIFNYNQYLDELHKRNNNYTIIWNFNYSQPITTPAADISRATDSSTRILQFATTTTAGAEFGGFKYDLNSFNQEYFDRLKDFVKKAGERGIIVNVILFNPIRGDASWSASVYKSTNNINALSAWTGTEASVNFHDTTSANPYLPYIRSLVAKTITELKPYDNVLYTLVNEPNNDNIMGYPFQKWFGRIVDSVQNTIGFNYKKIMAQNIMYSTSTAEGAPGLDSVVFTGTGANRLVDSVKMISWNYIDDFGKIDLIMEKNWHLNLPIAHTENGGNGSDLNENIILREAAMMLFCGGAGYNSYDLSFEYDDASGTGTNFYSWNGGSVNVRKRLGSLRELVEEMDFDNIYWENSLPISGNVLDSANGFSNCYAILDTVGDNYMVYLRNENLTARTIQFYLPSENYRIYTYNPTTGIKSNYTYPLHKAAGKVQYSLEATSDAGSVVVIQSVLPFTDTDAMEISVIGEGTVPYLKGEGLSGDGDNLVYDETNYVFKLFPTAGYSTTGYFQAIGSRSMFGYDGATNNWNTVVQAGLGKGIEFNVDNTFGAGTVMYLARNGNLGIGIGSYSALPSERLTVSGNVSASGNIEATGSLTAANGNFIVTSTSLNMESTGASIIKRNVTWDGNATALGLIHKTSASTMTDAFGLNVSLSIENSGGSSPIAQFGATRSGADNSGDLFFKTAKLGVFNSGFVLDKDGNLGIGTTTPTEKLEVSGNIKATSIITDFSVLTPQATAPSSPVNGTIYINSTDSTLRMYYGAWITLQRQ